MEKLINVEETFPPHAQGRCASGARGGQVGFHIFGRLKSSATKIKLAHWQTKGYENLTGYVRLFIIKNTYENRY